MVAINWRQLIVHLCLSFQTFLQDSNLFGAAIIEPWLWAICRLLYCWQVNVAAALTTDITSFGKVVIQFTAELNLKLPFSLAYIALFGHDTLLALTGWMESLQESKLAALYCETYTLIVFASLLAPLFPIVVPNWFTSSPGAVSLLNRSK